MKRASALLIDSADDATHCNGSITIAGGAFNISSGDDAMHADATLTVNAGEILITESSSWLSTRSSTLC